MLDFLDGVVSRKVQSDNHYQLVMNVHGFGLCLYVSFVDWNGVSEDESKKLFVSASYSTDSVKLFGFCDLESREVFDILSSIKGIAGKSALSILNNLTVRDIHQAVLDQNINAFVSIPGIGKKTAERICFELASQTKKLEKYISSDMLPFVKSELLADIRATLEELGYSPTEISDAVHKNISDYQVGKEEIFLRQCLTWLNL